MKMRSNELDEMQIQKRNMIGNQAYMLLFYLLLIDIGLYGFGFRWLKYPMNVYVIMMGCMTYYLLRIIWNNSYVGPRKDTKTIGRKIGFVLGLSGLVAGITIYLLGENSLISPISNNDNGAMLLFIFSIVSLIVLVVVGLISKWQTKGDE